MEGAEGHVRVYATFSDGATADVTAEPGMTLTSADDSIIEVLAGQGFPPQDPRVRVTSEVHLPPFLCG